MVPHETTRIHVTEELLALRDYAERHGWKIDWRPEPLVLIADGRHPADGSPARLHADLVGYKAVPPAWRFIDPASEDPRRVRCPEPQALPGGVNSVFHSSGVICAPFNRLAYKDHGGPHGDWNGPTAWLDVKKHVTAYCLRDMLAVLVMHLKCSKGWRRT